MAIFGLGNVATKTSKKKTAKKAAKKSGKQNKAAQAVLKKMAAKKDAGDCAFC